MEIHEIDEGMQKATEGILKYGTLHAKYRQLSYELQKGEKHILALLMKASNEKTTSAQEREALASSEYMAHIRKAADVLGKEVLSLHKYEHAKALFEGMRSRMSMSKKLWETT